LQRSATQINFPVLFAATLFRKKYRPENRN
jgi:hypothetical protein